MYAKHQQVRYHQYTGPHQLKTGRLLYVLLAGFYQIFPCIRTLKLGECLMD